MKHTSFLQAGLLVLLVALATSCGLPMNAEGGYYEETPSRRDVYIGDPYYRSPRSVIVERDPFTGRYYQVSPGGVYGAPVNPYYGRRHGNNRYYNNRSYNQGRNKNYYRTYPQTTQPQQAPAQREQIKQQREQARDAILGKKRN